MNVLKSFLLACLFLALARTAFAQEHTRVNRNFTLISGRNLYSTDGRYKLSMQQDGNLVLCKEANGVRRTVWASNTPGRAVQRCIFQADGNLVLYGFDGRAVWASGSNSKGGTYLSLQNDGNLVIYTGRDEPIWATGTDEKY